MAMLGSVPIEWGLKSSLIKFSEDTWWTEVLLSGVPVCHLLVKDLHADVLSAASEIYAASVALSEFLPLSYVSDETGWSIDLSFGDLSWQCCSGSLQQQEHTLFKALPY